MKPQELIFELMKAASFNDFDGDRVVSSLQENKELWTGVVFGRFDGYSELITLRDLPDYYNADTVCILAVKGKEKELELLAHRDWNADEIDYLPHEEASFKLGTSDGGSVLRVWWD